MAVNPVSIETALNQQSKTAIAGSQLAKDFTQFLTLLTTQLQNQDPLSPMDTNQFTQQLVAFAGVEQQINTNQKLDALVAQNLSGALSSAQSYVGQDISYVSSEFDYGGSPTTIKYSLPQDAASARINVTDESGKVVYSTDASKFAGAHEFKWDGTTNTGAKARPGTYEFKVAALDDADEAIKVQSVVTGRVRGTEVQNGQVFLLVGDRAVALGTVINTNKPNNSSSDALTMALDYIGMDVSYNNNKFRYDGSTYVAANYSLPEDADRAKYIVRNDSGQIIYTGDAPIGAGNRTVIWNGQRADGTTAPGGDYTIEIDAKSDDDLQIPATMTNTSRVTGVETINGQIHLVMSGGRSIPLIDILSANVPTSA